MTIIAKPVVDKRFWILQQDNVKIGNVEALDNGYQLKINNNVTHFKTIRSLEKNLDIKFETITRLECSPTETGVHGYPVEGEAHNAVWDLNKRLPLFTETKSSQCWHAAGWFSIKRDEEWVTMLCPKLILLERYPFKGPYHTKEEVEKND
jgi:hypothetical protein